MKRRKCSSVLVGSIIFLSGCLGEQSSPDSEQSTEGLEPENPLEDTDSDDLYDNEQLENETDYGNSQDTSEETKSKGAEAKEEQEYDDESESNAPDTEGSYVEGEFLSSESDSVANLESHRFENTQRTTSPWAVVGTVSQSSGKRANIQVSVNFIDANNIVISDTYDLLTKIASDQKAEFIVRYSGDDPDQVDSYEIYVEVS
jgi:hypothetical protein